MVFLASGSQPTAAARAKGSHVATPAAILPQRGGKGRRVLCRVGGVQPGGEEREEGGRLLKSSLTHFLSPLGTGSEGGSGRAFPGEGGAGGRGGGGRGGRGRGQTPVRCQAMKGTPPRSERGGASGAGRGATRPLDQQGVLLPFTIKNLQNGKRPSDALICRGNHFLFEASSVATV